MRSELVRIYKVVHTWTGLLAGMALFIAFYAGAITLFKEPLARWASPPSVTQALALEDVPSVMTRVIAEHPEAARDLRVYLAPEAPKERLEWDVPHAGADEHDNLSVRHFRATVEGGVPRAEELRRTHLPEFIDVLHRVVGLPVDRDELRWFMGVVAALYGVALFSGVVILVPSLVKDLFALRVGPNLKRMWLDAHNVVGILSLPFHVVMAVTAVIFAFHDGIYGLQDRIIHRGKLTATFQGGKPPADAKPRDPAKMLPPAEIAARVTAIAPDFEPEMLQYMQVTGPRAMVRVWGHDPKHVAFRFMGGIAMVDPYSGRVVSADYLPGRQNAATLTLSSVFALHFATFGGAPVKWMYFCLAMLGAWLFYGGNLLWVETRRKKASKRAGGAIPAQRRDTRLMASATVGVCLGAVSGISATIAAAKWLGHARDPNPWHERVYYAVFLGAIAWAFLRGPARAAVDLLRLAVATTLAIPVTSLVAVLVPALGMWAHRSTWGVDATALVLAFAFARMLRATRRRVAEGPADSVWSIHAPPAVAASPADAEPDAA